MATGIRRVVVNVPFKVAGGKYYSQAGVIESMPQEVIDRALKVNPNMITVLPVEETEQEETEQEETEQEETEQEETEQEDAESIEDAESEEEDKLKKTAKKKKDEE